MRAFYGTANSMARVLPLDVEIGERHSEAFVAHVAPALDQSASITS